MEQNNSFTKVDYNQYKDAYNKDVKKGKNKNPNEKKFKKVFKTT